MKRPLPLRALAALGRVAPGLAGRLAGSMFTRPTRHAPRTVELDAAIGSREEVLDDGTRLLHFGARGPRVLAIHGWEGRATQLAPLAWRLVSAGLRVTVIDAPAHGASPGRVAHVPAFARAVGRVARHLGDVEGLVGHSMGGGASLLALRDEGVTAQAIALISSPSSFARILGRFSDHVGLTAAARRAFFARMAHITGRRPEDLDLADGRITIPALVLHDPADAEVAFEHARALAAALPGARLVEAAGGHRAILRDIPALGAVARFLHEHLIARKDVSCALPTSSMPFARPGAEARPARAA